MLSSSNNNNPYQKHFTITRSPTIFENDCDLKSVPYYTEAVLILSGSVCFIVLFKEMERFIVDNNNLMTDKDTAKKNLIQLLAIYFAIYILLIIGLSPLYHYAYSTFVVLIVLIYTGIGLFYKLYTLGGAEISIVNQLPSFKSNHSPF